MLHSCASHAYYLLHAILHYITLHCTMVWCVISYKVVVLFCAAEHVKYVVLDEADKMLSLGLHPQLKRIRSLLIPRKSKSTQQEGVGNLVKPHTRRKRPQVLTCIQTWSLKHGHNLCCIVRTGVSCM